MIVMMFPATPMAEMRQKVTPFNQMYKWLKVSAVSWIRLR
jgi:hypothetical protein